MTATRFGSLVVLALGVLSAAPASAGEPTMSECLSANESAIKLRNDHKLRQARQQTLVCAASSCPGEVREACQARAKDLTAALPSIVFLAKDAVGHDVVAVRVSMDGVPIAEQLDGSAIAVDPGLHKFKFEVAGQPPVEQSFVLGEGQKDRRETIALAPSAGAVSGAGASGAGGPGTPSGVGAGGADLSGTPTTPDTGSPAPGAGQRVAGLVVGGVGVVGLGLGAVFGGLAASQWSSAKSECSGQPVSCTTDPNSSGFKDKDSASTMATLSTVMFIAGGALVAGGAVVFLTAPKARAGSSSALARRLELVPAGGPTGASLLLRGSF